MASKTLAVKYRPVTFDDVVEQNSIKVILQQQLTDGDFKNAYLFCGGAGTGKTTCARIFANEINKGLGNPIEMDAASNSGVDDVRNIIQQAKTKSLDSEYKVFIIDECHSISNTGWQAFLKLIEEPPAKSIFIFCTTDPQKIPKTILSRVQRYDFQRISQEGVVERLNYILYHEDIKDGVDADAVEYIAKIADGGMRDAISLMDKCLSYSNNLTLENVVKALGTVNYEEFILITNSIRDKQSTSLIEHLEQIYSSGKDIKQFVKQYLQFILDMCKLQLGCPWQYVSIPHIDEIASYVKDNNDFDFPSLLSTLINLNNDIKYSTAPKYDIEAQLLLYMGV